MKCRICGEKIELSGGNGCFWIDHRCEGDRFFAFVGKQCDTKEEAIKSVPDGIFLEDRVCG